MNYELRITDYGLWIMDLFVHIIRPFLSFRRKLFGDLLKSFLLNNIFGLVTANCLLFTVCSRQRYVYRYSGW
jgi:hypothetical protein